MPQRGGGHPQELPAALADQRDRAGSVRGEDELVGQDRPVVGQPLVALLALAPAGLRALAAEDLLAVVPGGQPVQQGVHDQRGQVPEALLLVAGQPGRARHGVDDAQGPQPGALAGQRRGGIQPGKPRGDQGRTGVKADVGWPADRAVGGEAGIPAGVRHHQHRVGAQGVDADGFRARGLARGDPVAGLVPLPVAVHQGHQRDGRAQDPRGQSRDPVKGRFRRGVQDIVARQRAQPRGFFGGRWERRRGERVHPERERARSPRPARGGCGPQRGAGG